MGLGLVVSADRQGGQPMPLPGAQWHGADWAPGPEAGAVRRDHSMGGWAGHRGPVSGDEVFAGPERARGPSLLLPGRGRQRTQLPPACPASRSSAAPGGPPELCSLQPEQRAICPGGSSPCSV